MRSDTSADALRFREIEQKYVVPLLENQNVSYVKLSADKPWQKELLYCIASMYRAKDDIVAPLTVSSLFLKMWSILFSNLNTSMSSENQSNDFTVLKNMIGYIQKFYRKKITLDNIALSGAVGQSKCCKLFNKYYRHDAKYVFNSIQAEPKYVVS